MNYKRPLFFGIGWLFVALLLHGFAQNPLRVERWFSGKWFPWVARVQSVLFGWLPFSLGDVLYGLLVFILILKLYRWFRHWRANELPQGWLITALLQVFNGLLAVYVIFNLCWGLNYDRKDVSDQLQLNMKPYTGSELQEIDSLLLAKTNYWRNQWVAAGAPVYSSAQILEKGIAASRIASDSFSFLHARHLHIKSSLWGWLGNYTGFMGYYNPFTGESQVNTTIPAFLQPYTSCHELAHQMGFAKENEANFVGYLAASRSPEPYFRYSVYLDLFLYSNRTLFRADSIAARRHAKMLDSGVRADLNLWRRFAEQHRNPTEPLFRWIYAAYLRNNRQPSGLLSYDEVTGFIIGCYRKFGRI